jgi:hypothetical protein
MDPQTDRLREAFKQLSLPSLSTLKENLRWIVQSVRSVMTTQTTLE